jgi:hypothetical protein
LVEGGKWQESLIMMPFKFASWRSIKEFFYKEETQFEFLEYYIFFFIKMLRTI